MMASYKAALSAAILLTKQDDAILCVALGSGSFLNVVAVLVDVCVCVCLCVFVCLCFWGRPHVQHILAVLQACRFGAFRSGGSFGW